MLPDYYYDEIKKVSTSLDNCGDGVGYVFITDIHYNSRYGTDEVRNAIMRQMEAVTVLANENEKIDFVAVGGDITTGMYDSKDACINDIYTVMSPLEKCKKPLLVLMGNHDDNCYHCYWSGGIPYRLPLILSEKDWAQKVTGKYGADLAHDRENPYSRYFYFDLKDKKVRVVALAANDYAEEYSEDGNVTALAVKNESGEYPPARYYSGATYWGYSDAELSWLKREALTAPDDYEYIFLSHMGIDFDTNCYNCKIFYGEELRKILGENADKIRLYHFGHNHTELTLYSEDIKLWQIAAATPSAEQYPKDGKIGKNTNNKSLPWKVYPREADTISEAAFDIIFTDGEEIRKIAFGAGEDRILKR